MRWEKFFDRATFFADEKTMIFVFVLALACTPFSESRDEVNEFLFPQEIQYSVNSHGIDREFFCDFIRSKRSTIFFEEGEYLLSGFCLPHRGIISLFFYMQYYCINKILQ
jgi:hypothetical protein